MQHDKRELTYFQEQSLDYKIETANERIRAWYESWCRFDIYDEATGKSRFVTMDTRDNSVPDIKDSEFITGIRPGQVYIAFSGGADSTVLLDLVRKIYPDVEAVFCNTGLEYPELRSFVKTFDNVTTIYPEMSFVEVIKKYGYPLISKEIADTIHLGRQNISEGKVTTRVQKLNGTYLTSQGKLSLSNCSKYKPLTEVDFIVGAECCDVMKKRPFKRYEYETGKKAILGVMADDSRLRKTQWMKSGCNAFDVKRPKSKPLSIWTTPDILQYIKRYDLPIASVYGEIVENPETNKLETTGCEHTGCMFCAFGAHIEKSSRFLRLSNTHPKQYDFCINGGCYNDKGLWEPSSKGLGMGHIGFRMGFDININDNIDNSNYTAINSYRSYYVPDPIPAPAIITLSNSSYAIGDWMSIGISSPFKNIYSFDFNYTFVNTTGVILTGYTGVNGYWSIPDELASQIPNKSSAQCVIECITYDENGTRLGSSSTQTTLTVSGDRFAPSFTLDTHYTVGRREFEQGIGDIGQWDVEGYALCMYGASVANIEMLINGNKNRVWQDTTDIYNNSGLNFQHWGNMSDFSKSGDSTIEVTVTDTRGLSTTQTITVHTLEYNKVRKNLVSVVRCNADGTPNDEGDNALVTVNGSISPVYDNKYIVTIRYKKTKQGDRDWTTMTINGDEGVSDINITRIINNIVAIDSYDFEITMSDTIRNYTIDRIVTNLILDSNNVDIDFYGNGTGLAFGGMAKEIGVADFYLPIRAQKGFIAPELVTGVDFNNMTTPGTYVNPQWNNASNTHSPDGNNDWQTILIVENTAVRKSVTGGMIYNKHITQTYIGVHQTSTINSYTTHGYAIYMRNGWYDYIGESYIWSPWYPISKNGDSSYRVLWSGAKCMDENTTINLNEKISAQPNGIALIFSTYADGSAHDYDFQDFFVSKHIVGLMNGKGHQFTLTAGSFTHNARKYLYIYDNKIVGNSYNKSSGTNNGITYDNTYFVLRYVIGL